ncbi:MAG: hypothetical protein NTX29_14820 [Actinobacteria bacterium]|nr:hypothetical protein [Actinomycetota bacterium]
MPVTSPDQCRDHSADWIEYFYGRRGGEILALIDEDLINEHRSNPMQLKAHHSANLHLVLNFFRNAPIIGKEFVYAVRPYEAYQVGVVTSRGTAGALLDDTTYTTEDEAVHAVFMARVNKLRATQSALNSKVMNP